MPAFPGFTLATILVVLVIGVVVTIARRRENILPGYVSPETKRKGRSIAGAAIGVGLASAAIGARGNALFEPRSFLAWTAVAFIVVVPVYSLAVVMDRWLQARGTSEDYERVAQGHLPSKESGLRGIAHPDNDRHPCRLPFLPLPRDQVRGEDSCWNLPRSTPGWTS